MSSVARSRFDWLNEELRPRSSWLTKPVGPRTQFITIDPDCIKPGDLVRNARTGENFGIFAVDGTRATTYRSMGSIKGARMLVGDELIVIAVMAVGCIERSPS